MDDVKFLINEKYKLVDVLGKGSYGTVCSAVDNKTSKCQIAIKKVTRIFEREILMKRALRELKLMKHFNGHKNIISLLDLDLIAQQPYEGLYCYQELCDYDLARVIYSTMQFSEFHIQSFIYQILCGLKYIHSADVIHRDLKPGNILVTIQGILKICDFGLARGINTEFFIVGDTKPQLITNYVATRWYRAPELMLSKKNYDKSIDLWSVGCILAELYGRKPIFIGKNQLNQLQEICKVLGSPSKTLIFKNGWNINLLKLNYTNTGLSSLYPFASSKAIDLMENLLTWDPNQRLTVIDCLNHSFVLPVRDSTNEPSCTDIFDFSFEYDYITIDELKDKLQAEVEFFKIQRLG
ncbi:mitogen-activated protein kinase Hog1p [[Candida] jaroonii]|uniref:Mitogen-activated protein kinase Hog1p n=1 Tax=[Candida] jaroonii TaxID=467808 RepID=A0ACA9Y788_9ASCO|nr:mitogen-activated protein kinase Hog1p [[Candida] jaroonii]